MRKTVLIVYTLRSTFVQKDIDSISKENKVLLYQFNTNKSLGGIIFEFFKLFFYLSFRIWQIDVVLSWFCDYHAFLPIKFAKLFRKKSMIIIGGFDAVSVPHLDYGLFNKTGIRTYLAESTYRSVGVLLPVDKSLIQGVNMYGDPKGKGYPVGVKSFVSNVKAEVVVLPTGYDPIKWTNIISGTRNNKTIISVAYINSLKTFRLKGFDLLIETAKLLPEFTFTLVGFNSEMKVYAEALAGSNVNIISSVNNEELPEFLSKHYMYAQLSDSEGLPNSLCEAMLCECIPIGSAVNGIPTGIGDTGFILEKRDPEMAAELFRSGAECATDKGAEARTRIINHFSHEKREKKLLELLANDN